MVRPVRRPIPASITARISSSGRNASSTLPDAPAWSGIGRPSSTAWRMSWLLSTFSMHTRWRSMTTLRFTVSPVCRASSWITGSATWLMWVWERKRVPSRKGVSPMRYRALAGSRARKPRLTRTVTSRCTVALGRRTARLSSEMPISRPSRRKARRMSRVRSAARAEPPAGRGVVVRLGSMMWNGVPQWTFGPPGARSCDLLLRAEIRRGQHDRRRAGVVAVGHQNFLEPALVRGDAGPHVGLAAVREAVRPIRQLELLAREQLLRDGGVVRRPGALDPLADQMYGAPPPAVVTGGAAVEPLEEGQAQYFGFPLRLGAAKRPRVDAVVIEPGRIKPLVPVAHRLHVGRVLQ